MNEIEGNAFVNLIGRAIPDAAFKSSVAIVASNCGIMRHKGSGTLFAIADRKFLITAGHVVKSIHEEGSSLGIAAFGWENFIAVNENWILSDKGDSPGGNDLYDIAICSLTSEQVKILSKCVFVRISDVLFDLELSNGYFVVSGYPSLWTTTSCSKDDIMSLRPLQYSTCAFRGSTAALDAFHPRYHFLIDAKPEQILDSSGKAMRFRTLGGHAAQMPKDLQGISGCAVWMIGDLRIAYERWEGSQARLVGVETGIYAARSAIKVSRWSTVITLIDSAFPDLRPAIEIHQEI